MLLNREKLNTVVQLTSHLTRIFGVRQAEDKSLRSVVYKVKPLSHYSDSWEWTIVEQSNGKTISNIVESLYLEALGNGARLADIGIWKSLFDRTVLAKVYQLADGGYIRLLNDREERQDSVPTSVDQYLQNFKATGKGGDAYKKPVATYDKSYVEIDT